MSAIGLPMAEHVSPHLDDTGLCHCPCDQCVTRLAKFCVCLDCRCDDVADRRTLVGRHADDVTPG